MPKNGFTAYVIDPLVKISQYVYMSEMGMSPLRRIAVIMLLLAGSVQANSVLAQEGVEGQPAELVLFERRGCVWCARWLREVGPIYPKTQEGAKAPLRRVDLDDRQHREDGLAEIVFFTPTFVLKRAGREVGRITGYINDDMFWGLLGKLLERDGSAAATATGRHGGT